MSDDLSAIADEMTALLAKFRSGSSMSGLLLPTEHEARFKRLAIQAKSQIDEALGHANDFSLNLIHAINSGSGGFFGGPSYAAVSEAAEIVRGAASHVDRKRSLPATLMLGAPPYIDPSVIAALRSISGGSWDFTRLSELCRELNVVSGNECYMATAMVVRAIVDHVPPVFRCKTFAEVASSYGGSRSFKEHMAHLDKSLRKVADGYLHTQIRQREGVPTSVQVDFRAALGELLGEVIRISKP
jgi:hypothetical protein